MAQDPLKKTASGPQPLLEKLPPDTLTPILSYSASICSPPSRRPPWPSPVTSALGTGGSLRTGIQMGYMSGLHGWVTPTSHPSPKLWELGEGSGSHLDQVTRGRHWGPVLQAQSSPKEVHPGATGGQKTRLSPSGQAHRSVSLVGEQGARGQTRLPLFTHQPLRLPQARGPCSHVDSHHSLPVQGCLQAGQKGHLHTPRLHGWM